MYGVIAQAAIERRQSLKAAAEERVRTAVATERARREAEQVAERKKRRVKDVLALADKGAMGSLFQMWDRDGSGFIDREEFREQVTILCREHGFEVSDEALELTWADFDLDGSGTVTYEEWLRITLRDLLVQGNMRIMEAFRAWDRDFSGTIDRREFCDALCTLGFDAPRVLVEEVFDSMDRDGSGALSFEELNKQLRQGSAVRGRLDDALHAGQVKLDTSRSFKNALRKSPGGGGVFGSGGGGTGASSLVAQMKRHIQTTADSEPRGDATPAAPQPAPQPDLPQETNLWVLRMLASVGPRQAASIRHTAVNDDHTTLASAVGSNAAAAASASAAMHARSAALAAATAERSRQKATTPQHLIDLLDRTAPSPPAKAPSPVWPPSAPTVIRPPSAPAMLGSYRSSASMQSLQSLQSALTEEGSPARHQPSRTSLRRSASSGMLSGTRSSAPGTALGSRESRGAFVANGSSPRGSSQSEVIRGAQLSSPRGSSPPSRPSLPSTTIQKRPDAMAPFLVPDARKLCRQSSLISSWTIGGPGQSSLTAHDHDLRHATLPPPASAVAAAADGRLTRIQARIGPATCLIVPKVTEPHRSIDENGMACWVRQGTYSDAAMAWPLPGAGVVESSQDPRRRGPILARYSQKGYDRLPPRS